MRSMLYTIHTNKPATIDRLTTASVLASQTEGKTWMGCGAHVPSVMDKIPVMQWCSCEQGRVVKGGKTYPPMGSWSLTGMGKAIFGW